MAKAKAMKKAQSILEYVIMLTAIVGAILLASGSMGAKIQTGRNVAADSIGASFGLTPNVRPAPPGPPADPDDPIIPGSDAQVTIPTSMYLTTQQIRDLVAVGILIGGRSNYNPADQKIEIIGTLTKPQQDAVAKVQKEQDECRAAGNCRGPG
jgi:hypothetical protein